MPKSTPASSYRSVRRKHAKDRRVPIVLVTDQNFFFLLDIRGFLARQTLRQLQATAQQQRRVAAQFLQDIGQAASEMPGRLGRLMAQDEARHQGPE